MSTTVSAGRLRPLHAEDLERVIAIDAAITGRVRRGFFEKRLQAALQEPRDFAYTACVDDEGVQGFLLARILRGEFGGHRPVAVMDSLGVNPEHQFAGIGRALMNETRDHLKRHGVGEMQSQADWRNFSILRFFAATGFRLAPRYIVERPVGIIDIPDDEPEAADAVTEIDYSRPAHDDYTMLTRDRIRCRSLRAEDTPALVRIDRKLFHRDHGAYYQQKVAEAMGESGVRVSMVAEQDDGIVGFIMARVDFGEFARTEPVAVLDTLSVDPDFQHRHVGTALLSQLMANLTGLRVDRIRTEVAAGQADIYGFLLNCGFEPAQQLAFSLKLSG